MISKYVDIYVKFLLTSDLPFKNVPVNKLNNQIWTFLGTR